MVYLCTIFFYICLIFPPVKSKMVQKSTTPNFDSVFSRISGAIGIKSIRQLAEIIEKNHTTILAARVKDNFPANWAYEIEKKYGLLTGWIMTGEGPKRRSEEAPVNPLLVEVNEWLNEEGKQEDAEFKIFFRQQMIRAFFDYEKWIKKRKVSLGSGEEVPARKIA